MFHLFLSLLIESSGISCIYIPSIKIDFILIKKKRGRGMFILSKPTSLEELFRLPKKYLLCKTQPQFKISGPQRKPTDNRTQWVIYGKDP